MSTRDRRVRRALRRSLRNAAADLYEACGRLDGGADTGLAYGRAVAIAETAATRLKRFDNLHRKG